MPPMRPLALALVGRLLLAQLAVIAALGVLVSVAALVEGHPPGLDRLRLVAVGGGAALGAAWTLAAWRRAAGDVALAALGVPPGRVVGLLCLAAAPALAAAGGPAREPGLIVDATTLRLPGATVRWVDGVATRSDVAAPFPGLPAPGAPPAGPRSPWLLLLGRLAGLAAGLAWLARRARLPDAPAALAAGAAAALLGALPALWP